MNRVHLALLLTACAVSHCLAVDIPGITPPGGAKVEKLAGGMQFTEGPATHSSGAVYFTDLPSERILSWRDGKVTVVREKSGRANGLAFDAAGRLIACEMNHHHLSATGPDGKTVPIISAFQGKELNQTNDLAIDSAGGIYFSDPYYGAERSLPQDRMAVYYLKPDGKTLVRVVQKGPQKPNGVLLSPDGKFLYVIDSEKPTIWCYAIKAPGEASPAGSDGRFAELRLPMGKTRGGGDGGAVDAHGNLYVATEMGIQVINPAGMLLGIIPFPEQPANCAFFGKDNKSLFVTARTSIYKVDLLIPGAPLPPISAPKS